ncbi:MAG: Multifunctional CCA protein [Syntrophomonadaceae bacterium]|nr:Multifunctional CCA protein [Bacillota bacterium]
MRAVTTHKNADFDALASMVAAGKLYPGAVLLSPGVLNQNVQEFASLYKDVLNIRSPREVDLSQLEMLVVTDTRQKERLALPAALLERVAQIHVYDHHPPADDDLPASLLVGEAVGATTTLLMEKILELQLPLSPFEATLFALGIYEDTGCLTYTGTSERDVAMLHRLWQAGVNVRVVNEFLHKPLSEGQRSILDELLAATEYHEPHGVRVAVTFADSADYVGGLALLTHKLIEIEDVDIVFSVVAMEDRIYIVGRSRLDHFDLTQVLTPFGGKGHARAASATVKGSSLQEVKEKLTAVMYQQLFPVTAAKDIMSSPVRSIEPETPVDRARELMLRYGHSGFPVVEGEKLVGIISRRDLEKAAHHGFGHAPVKGYMNRNPLIAAPEMPVKKLQQIMIEHNVGRLPVLESENIVGIVTRTDVLRNLEGVPKINCAVSSSLPQHGEDLTPLFKERLSRQLQSLLLLVGQKADRENVRVYVVGGFVRDLLLGLPTQDLDLVVEGEAIAFAGRLNELLAGRLKVHEQFGTAQLQFADGTRVDLASSRQEFYARPAALPEVEQSSLKKDLFRRDFTINTLACALNAPHFGELHDYFHGTQDLDNGLIRILYNLSFVEDPLRLLRAIRFEQRFGFALEETTRSLLENAVHSRLLGKVSKERLYEELKPVWLEEKAPEILSRYFELGVAADLFPGVRLGEQIRQRLRSVREMIKFAARAWPDAAPLPSVLYLAALLQEMPFQEIRHLSRRLRLHREERERLLAAVQAVPDLLELLQAAEPLSAGRIYYALTGQPVETLLLLRAESSSSRIWEATSLYWEKLRHQKPGVSGDDLVRMGYQPGPRFQRVLRAVRLARLDGRVSSKEAEMALIKQLFAEEEYEKGPDHHADR